MQAYNELLTGLEQRLRRRRATATLRRKQARQAARAVLPNATETRIVVTGNYRAWRHFIATRASEHADVEIRALAVACLRQLHRRGAERVRRLRDQHAVRRHRDRRESVRPPVLRVRRVRRHGTRWVAAMSEPSASDHREADSSPRGSR